MEKSALVYILLTAVTVGIAYFVKSDRMEPADGCGRSCLSRGRARSNAAEFAIFALLFGVSACRIAVGNDYWVYRFNFNLIAQERHVSYELGFNLIVKGMNWLFGYDNYLPIFALFSFLTVLFFSLALHSQATDYALSLFLLMTGGYYFNSLNSVRYYLALAMALFSMKYVLAEEWEKFVFWILIAAMFHKSVLLVIPVYFLAWFLAKKRLKKQYYILMAIFVLIAIFFGKNLIREAIFFFYPYYRGSAFDQGKISFVNIAKCVSTIVLGAFCYRTSLKEEVTDRFYYYLNIFGLLTYCCGSFMPEISRVGYYMIISQIFLLPRLIEKIGSKKIRMFFYAGLIGAYLLYFGLLLKSMYAVDVRLLPYRNWIFD